MMVSVCVARCRLEAKRAEEQRYAVSDALEREKATCEELSRRISALRSEREAAALASDSAMRLRLKRQELLMKEQQVRRRAAHHNTPPAAIANSSASLNPLPLRVIKSLMK